MVSYLFEAPAPFFITDTSTLTYPTAEYLSTTSVVRSSVRDSFLFVCNFAVVMVHRYAWELGNELNSVLNGAVGAETQVMVPVCLQSRSAVSVRMHLLPRSIFFFSFISFHAFARIHVIHLST